MTPIVTLTLNPAIDATSEAETVQPTHKVRTTNEQYSPGGGGINVARVVHRLGGATLALYLAGGLNGHLLDGLVERAGIPGQRVTTAGKSRVSHVVLERSTGQEYRFVPEGPEILPAESAAILAAAADTSCDYVVASGSLPKGVPNDFYARAAEVMRERGARVVLDTSGEPLRRALAAGGIFLAKPSLREFEALVGRPLRNADEQERAAREFVGKGCVDILAITLGPEGGLLATAERVVRLAAPEVDVKSTVGAGDSFLAAMVLRLAEGLPPEEAFRWGVAAGTAATLTSHSDLCSRDDVERLHGVLANAGWAMAG